MFGQALSHGFLFKSALLKHSQRHGKEGMHKKKKGGGHKGEEGRVVLVKLMVSRPFFLCVCVRWDVAV